MKPFNNNIVILLFLLFSFASCESFLTEEPWSFPSGETLFTSEENAELALTGVYDILNAGNIQGQGNHPLWGRGIHYLTILGCDEVIGNLNSISDPHHKVFANYAYNSESEFLANAWFAFYAGINRCNNIIHYVPGISSMDEHRREQIIAEARFFRAFYHTYLSWLFGGVPVVENINPDSKVPRNSLKEVFESVEEDFLYAYTTLDDRNIKEGRINKYTAGMMLAKVYLYLASCQENAVSSDTSIALNGFDWVDASSFFLKAGEICADLYTNSGYRLHSNYNYLFIADTKGMKDEQLEEVLMPVQTGTGGSNEYLLFSYLTGPQGNVGTNGGNYGWLRGMGELADRYVAEHDLRGFQNITGNVGTATQTIKGVRYYATVAVNTIGSNYCIGKFRQSDPATRTALGVPTWASTLNFPLLRFGDLILMYAEAAYKNGNEPLARELLYEIRLRAAGNNPEAARILTQSYELPDFMEELFHERSRELCAEGWRRFDLIRWGKLASTVQNLKTEGKAGQATNYYYWNGQYAQDVKANFYEYKIWYPIPKRELEINENFIPNPGYSADTNSN